MHININTHFNKCDLIESQINNNYYKKLPQKIHQNSRIQKTCLQASSYKYLKLQSEC